MNDIITNENSPVNIDRLDAQRHLYSKAKVYSAVTIILCIIVPVVISFLKVIYPGVDLLIKGAIVYSFLALFAKQLLASLASSYKNLAARIQQLFDCELFHLNWNEALCGKQPLPEEVFDAKTGKRIEELQNWYEPIIQQLPHNYGVIVCMRTNVVYDQRLRKTFSRLVDAFIICSLVFVFTVGIVQNRNTWDWFLNAIVPLMPIISWFIDIWIQNTKNIETLNKLQSLIDKSLTMAVQHQDIPVADLARIQNFMFLHRNTSYTIPDLIYKCLRSKSERAAYYSAQQLYDQINRNNQ